MAKRVTNSNLGAKMDTLADEVQLVKKLLNGNGTPEQGLVVKVDRLTVLEAARTWHFRALWTAAIAALLGAIASLMMGKN